jgi:hypothetical protein
VTISATRNSSDYAATRTPKWSSKSMAEADESAARIINRIKASHRNANEPEKHRILWAIHFSRWLGHPGRYIHNILACDLRQLLCAVFYDLPLEFVLSVILEV